MVVFQVGKNFQPPLSVAFFWLGIDFDYLRRSGTSNRPVLAMRGGLICLKSRNDVSKVDSEHH